MNKYLEKIAGFMGQSTEHLTKRLGQLGTAIENNLPKRIATNSGKVSDIGGARGLQQAGNRFDRVSNEITDRGMARIRRALSPSGGTTKVGLLDKFRNKFPKNDGIIND